MTHVALSDDDLAWLAAGGDPDAPLPADAVPWTHVVDADRSGSDGLLPEWYMPAPAGGARAVTGWRRAVAWVLVVATLAVVASGLCNTYGQLVVA